MEAGARRIVPPGIASRLVRVLILGRRLLPLDLGGEPKPVSAGEGVGLEPGDVDDGTMRVEWLQRSEAPLRGEVRRPASRSRDVVLLLPVPALVRPPFAAL